jgi:uncharacterized membrane protein
VDARSRRTDDRLDDLAAHAEAAATSVANKLREFRVDVREDIRDVRSELRDLRRRATKVTAGCSVSR